MQVPNVLRSLLFRPHHEMGKEFGNNYEGFFSWLMQSLMFCKILFRPRHEVGKCFGNNYEGYFSWLMQSLMFCEACCSGYITKWESVLEKIMNNISVGLCSP